jgi:hypothetical protein
MISLPFELPIVMFRTIKGKVVTTSLKNGNIVPLGLDKTDSGYIRWDGITNFNQVQEIGCGVYLYEATSRFYIVVACDNYKPDSIKAKILSQLRGDFSVVQVSENQETIRREEDKKTDLHLLKITFDRIETTLNPCDYELECIC